MDRAKTKSKRLSPADWADEALVAVVRGGLSAVAVELLAAQLGVTKGSFYWHFSNRAALIAYVAMLYEEMGLDVVAARHRAVMAVSMFLGHLQLARAAPASLPDDDAAWHQHVDAVTDTLLDLR